jgi:hypothetical protein|uniref:Uncharacterized protein n=1 Tax=uncultured marine virus TaxID=186617 RepID=A0A0F7L8E5_9VIRU|nr:hypothetical protein [uncultured marine virus]
MPATGEAGRKAQAEARQKLKKLSNPRSSNIIQPMAVPPMGDEEYIRLRCLEFATANSSKVGIENPYDLATKYANYVLTGSPDIA